MDKSLESRDVPALRVEGLTLAAGEAKIVDQASFEVRRGEILSIVGESGSGKTAIALALLGHARTGMRITQGTVEVAGTGNMLALSPDEIRHARGSAISYVPQDASSSLNPRMKIGKQLRESMAVHGIPDEEIERRAIELVERVGLPSRVHGAYPFQISGGQQQRLLIAMAVAVHPRIVVLDEPTTGLDVTSQAKVLDLIAELAEEDHIAFVYITHDLAVVEKISHRIAVMYSGSLIEVGPKDDLVKHPLHPYTSLLLDSVPRISYAHKGSGIPGTMPNPANRPSGCHFRLRCPIATEKCAEEFPPAQGEPEHLAHCWYPGKLQVKSERFNEDAIVPTAGDPLLDVRDLEIRYGKSDPVVKGITFSVFPGECVALVGESGSGKSTTGRSIAGLLPQSSGTITMAGIELAPSVEKRSPQQREKLQLIFQNPDRSLNPTQTVKQIIGRPLELFGLTTRRKARADIGEFLDRVHLSRRALDKYPYELSGGEKQRVAIARALAARPDLLICDEVTSALDVSVQASIIKLLAELRADGLAMLFITHNLGVVRSLADRTLVMQYGELLEQGNTVSVLSRPEHDYTKSLLAAAPELPANA